MTTAIAGLPASMRERLATLEVGKIIDPTGKKNIKLKTALGAACLDWDVEKVPLWAQDDPELDLNDTPGPTSLLPTLDRVERYYGVQRSSDGFILGCVGNDYTCVPNVDGFSVLADAQEVSDQNLWIETLGSADEGRYVWIQSRLDDMLIGDDAIAQYLLFSTRHDGRQSVVAAASGVHQATGSTLNFKIPKIRRIYRVRHTKNVQQRMKQAKEILGLRHRYIEEIQRLGDWLASQKLSGGKFEEFVDQLLPMPPIKDGKTETPARTMCEQRREKLRECYIARQDKTKWGALTATAAYADHERPLKSVESKMKAQIGDAKIKDSAMLLLAAERLHS